MNLTASSRVLTSREVSFWIKLKLNKRNNNRICVASFSSRTIFICNCFFDNALPRFQLESHLQYLLCNFFPLCSASARVATVDRSHAIATTVHIPCSRNKYKKDDAPFIIAVTYVSLNIMYMDPLHVNLLYKIFILI